MSLMGRAVTVLVALAVVVAGGAAFLYFSDYGVEATVTDKGRDSSGSFVVATTKLGGVDVKEYLPVTEWSAVQVGNFVVYKVRSGDITVFTSEGGRQVYPVPGL